MGNEIYKIGFQFRKDNNGLRFQPKTHHDLKSKDVFDQAAKRATELESDAAEMESIVLSFDQGEHDYNKNPGEVLLRKAPHTHRIFSGHLFEDRMELEVKDGEGQKIYEKDGDKLERRTIKSEWEGELYESIRSKDDTRDYWIGGPPQLVPFSGFSYGYNDKPTFTTKELKWSERLQRGADGKFGGNPRTLEELEKIESEQHMYDRGNEAIDRVKAFHDVARALDQTDGDLNPKEGEVLFKDLKFRDKTYQGTILHTSTLEGFDEWGKGSSNWAHTSYMRAVTQDGSELLELIEGDAHRNLCSKVSDRFCSDSDNEVLMAFENEEYRIESKLRDGYSVGYTALYESEAKPPAQDAKVATDSSNKPKDKDSGWFPWS